MFYRLAPWLAACAALACDSRREPPAARPFASATHAEPAPPPRPAHEAAAHTVPDAGAAQDDAPTVPAWPELRLREPGLGSLRLQHAGRTFHAAVWDSHWFELSLVAGRVEHSADGAFPDALKPRARAAFNGGFRRVHGHYGVRVAGHEHVPPRADRPLATLARFDSGWWLGEADGAALHDATDLRQNLPPLWSEGRFNPRGVQHFGALAPGKAQGATTRSALALRRDGALLYLYGIDVTAEQLAGAAAQAGAAFAMALDMNDGQVGFEWLRFEPLPAAARPPPRARPSDRATQPHWSGRLGGEWVHAERLSTPMGTPLPRWADGDGRDFFVLHSRTQRGTPVRLGMPSVPEKAP